MSQLWQDGVQASDFLYSDTAFAALPNGTTLYSRPDSCPSGLLERCQRQTVRARRCVQDRNDGNTEWRATTCTGSRDTSVLTCTSAPDLSVGQRIAIGTRRKQDDQLCDATDPTAVLVNLTSNLAARTPTALSFSAPAWARDAAADKVFERAFFARLVARRHGAELRAPRPTASRPGSTSRPVHPDIGLGFLWATTRGRLPPRSSPARAQRRPFAQARQHHPAHSCSLAQAPRRPLAPRARARRPCNRFF